MEESGITWLGAPLQVLAIAAGAIITRWIVVRLIRRTFSGIERSSLARQYASTRAGRLPGPEDTQAILLRHSARSRAVATLLSSVASFVILFIAVVWILAVLGVNVAPILASAGVVGIALGFGAQNLVRDLISGIFIIVEDQFGVGDTVDMPTRATGVVEQVGLRSTRLRDDDGTVWYVPNGLITSVGNSSQGHSVARVDIAVSYDTDLRAARTALRDAVEDLSADPAWADRLLDAEPTLTVGALEATAVLLRAAVQTIAGAQVAVADELRERALRAMTLAGVTPLAAPVPPPRDLVEDSDSVGDS
jgi:small conductance mechanosensitive channel